MAGAVGARRVGGKSERNPGEKSCRTWHICEELGFVLSEGETTGKFIYSRDMMALLFLNGVTLDTVFKLWQKGKRQKEAERWEGHCNKTGESVVGGTMVTATPLKRSGWIPNILFWAWGDLLPDSSRMTLVWTTAKKVSPFPEMGKTPEKAGWGRNRS